MYTHTLIDPLLHTHKRTSSLAYEFLSALPSLFHAQSYHSTLRLTSLAVRTGALITQCTEVVSGANLCARLWKASLTRTLCVLASLLSLYSERLQSVCQEVTATAGNGFVHGQSLVHTACQVQGRCRALPRPPPGVLLTGGLISLSTFSHLLIISLFIHLSSICLSISIYHHSIIIIIPIIITLSLCS